MKYKAIIPLSLPASPRVCTHIHIYRIHTYIYTERRTPARAPFLSYASRASAYQHLEGVQRLRLISTCLLKPSIPFWRRARERARSPDAPISSGEIRFSNPSLTTPTFCNLLPLPLRRRKGHPRGVSPCESERSRAPKFGTKDTTGARTKRLPKSLDRTFLRLVLSSPLLVPRTCSAVAFGENTPRALIEQLTPLLRQSAF